MFAALKKSRELQLLIAIVVVGLGLRLWGIEHGFPFIFHPDEPAVVRSATGIRFEANPKHFDWPHLHFYLNYFVYFLFIKFRGLLQALDLRTFVAAQFPLLWQDPLVFYWLSRVFNAFLGAFTAIPVFLAGRALFNAKVGLLAALALVLMPLHVHTSHFALIDIPTAFWVSWAVYFSVLAYQKPEILKNWVLAGLFVGLAASTKYNGALAAAVVISAWVLSKDRLQNFKFLALAALTSLLGFFAGTPYALLDWDTFTRTDSPVGALWQFSNVGSVDFGTRIQQFLGVISTTFASEFGYVFITLFLIFIVYSIFNRDKRNWLVIIPALFLFYYTAGFEKVRSHYFLITFPFVALSVGILLDLITSKLLKNKKLAAIFILVMFSLPFSLSFQRSLFLYRKDTKVLLYEWLQQNTSFDDYMVYNSSSIEPVVHKISKDLSEKGLITVNLEGRKGYIIIYAGDDGVGEEELDFVEDLPKIYEILPNGRRGSEIIIYAFDKISEN